MTQQPRPVSGAFIRYAEPAQWQGAALSQQVFFDDADGGLRLGDVNATAIQPTEPGGTFGGLTRPTGLAVGPDGRLFLADPTAHVILTYTVAQAAFTALWPARSEDPPDGYMLRSPRGVAISRDGDLVVADTGHARMIVYAWPGLAVRQIIELPNGEPWDLAYDTRGRLYVADAAAGRVWRFDRLWRPDAAYTGGQGVLVGPRHLGVDSADRVLVIDTVLRAIVALDEDGEPAAVESQRTVLDGHGVPLPALDPPRHTRTFPPPLRVEGTELWLPQDTRPNCPALPLTGLAVDRRGRLAGTGLLLLARPATVRYPRTGRYITLALDSGIINCAWHRLVLDTTIPTGTSLTVRTFTAPSALEPARILELSDSRWSRPLSITENDWPEVLIQSPPGRCLWVRLDLSSTGDATPLVRALTLYAPRQSSLAYLPPVFREDAVSADFLDRFLSYTDTIFDEIESQIERFTGYLDPDGVPAGEFLAWLGSWLDIRFLAEWPEATRREFVRRAITLHRKRGTVAGLQVVLRLHAAIAAPHPVIIEHFRLRNYLQNRDPGVADLVNGQPYLAGLPLLPGSTAVAHHFTVVVPAPAVPDNAARETFSRLIAELKPAHTDFVLRFVQPGVRIGCQSTVGVDALIGPYPSAAVGEMRLAGSSVLAAPPPTGLRVGYQHLSLG